MPREERPPAEWFNFATHLLGALLAAAGLVYLVVRAEGPLATTAYSIYGGSLVLLFSSSSLHHALSPTGERTDPLRRLDHVSIYLLIAGTYTPACLLGLPRAWGIPLLAVVWGFALVGIGLKVFRPLTSRWVTIALYVGLGWAAVSAIVPIYRLTPMPGFLLLVGGGLLYTGGAIVYALNRPDPLPRYIGAHGIWHIFVLAASGMLYAFTAIYVPAR